MKIKGLNKVIANINHKAKDTEKGIEKGIERATLLLLREVKQSIAGRKSLPVTVDTGRFLNSVECVTKRNEGAVFSDLDYAVHIEYGTKRMAKRPHFNVSKNRIQDKINNEIARAVNNNIR